MLERGPLFCGGAQQFLHPVGDHTCRRTGAVFGKLVSDGRAFEVHLYRVGPVAAGLCDETGGGVDVARCTDGRENIGLGQMIKNRIHVIGHFAEPHDVRSRGGGLAGGAGIADCHHHRRGPTVIAAGAERRVQRAVHMDHPRAALFMQVIDVLGHDDDLTRIVLLQLGQTTRLSKHPA